MYLDPRALQVLPLQINTFIGDSFPNTVFDTRRPHLSYFVQIYGELSPRLVVRPKIRALDNFSRSVAYFDPFDKMTIFLRMLGTECADFDKQLVLDHAVYRNMLAFDLGHIVEVGNLHDLFDNFDKLVFARLAMRAGKGRFVDVFERRSRNYSEFLDSQLGIVYVSALCANRSGHASCIGQKAKNASTAGWLTFS
jgi:hypothetical protein